jgi:hypothetical protein
MKELEVTAQSVTVTTEWAAVALMAVTCLSLAGLLVALVALERTHA